MNKGVFYRGYWMIFQGMVNETDIGKGNGLTD